MLGRIPGQLAPIDRFPEIFNSIPYQKGPEICDHVCKKADTIAGHFAYDLPDFSSGGE
jgi:hypothetical protein